MTLFNSRNYHALALGLLLFYLIAYGPYFAQETLSGSYGNITLFETPAVDDLEAVLSQRVVFWIGIVVVLLLSNNDGWLRVGTLVGVASGVVIAITQLQTIYTSAFGFGGNYVAALAPTLAHLAFGVIVVVKEGGLKGLLPFRDLSESDPLLNIAVIASDIYAALVFGNILLRYSEYATVFPAAVRPALNSVIAEGLARYASVIYLVHVVMRAVLYRVGTRHERSAIAALMLLANVYASEFGGWHRILGDSALYMRTFLSVLLAVGIRRNQNVSGPSFNLTLRNALWGVLVFNIFYHVQSTPSIVAGFWEKWLGSKALSFATPAPMFYYSMQHYTSLGLFATGWIAFVHDHEAASRTSLLTFVSHHIVWTLIFLVKANVYGFSTANAALLVVQSGAVVTLAVKAISDSLRGESFGSYVRSVFAWSYAPLKGGLYMQVLVLLASSVLMFLPNDPISLHATWQTEEAKLARFGFGVTLLLSGLSLYVTTRVADRNVARSLTFFVLGTNLYTVIAVPFAKLAPAVFPHLQHYALGRIVDTAMSVVMISSLLASLYIDFHRTAAAAGDADEAPRSPRTPRGGRRRKVE